MEANLNLTIDVSLADNLDTTVPVVYTTGIVVALILSFFIVITVCGQLLVILAIITEKALRTPSNYCIISLALTDLILAVIVMPIAMLMEIWGGVWFFGKHFCDVFIFFDVLCCTASIYNLCLISLDRYLSIISPIRYSVRRTPTRALVGIIICWSICILISVIRPIGWKTVSGDAHFCGLVNGGFRIFSSLLSFYVPLVVMLFVYYKMFQAARSRLKKIRDVGGGTVHVLAISECEIRQNSSSVSNPTDSSRGRRAMPSNSHANGRQYAWPETTDTNPDHTVELASESGNVNTQSQNVSSYQPGTQRNIPERISGQSNSLGKNVGKKGDRFSLAKERKAARTLGVVMGAFIACWAPFFLFNVIVPYCHTCKVTPALFSVLTWLGYANSMLNPFIYTYFNKDFRKAFKRLVSCGHWQ
ncbi:5-hydroxytryptamine receptor 1A-alpha-like [Saccoglossus kowalevskii]|uniref:D(1A) dopamine receptor-like n=1 Tax=Saccoglossus kowalevskii TaxID=10224 RepID=A0ABM0LY59_SACKO|nr:PREDICTED: D(1A) dopamine receptor-like [Saccoglossus kowalevskii]